MRNRTIRRANRFILRHRMFIFLNTLLFLLIVYPFVHEHFTDYLALMELFLSLIMIAGIFIVSANRELLTIAILLGILTFTVIWFNLILKSLSLFIFGMSLEIIFFTLTTTTILTHVLSYRKITADKIYGAICGYLLIGIIYALIYTMIENIAPGSFEFSHNLRAGFHGVSQYPVYFAHFIYYSFITITTLGFGDITPISSAARVISSLEAIFGQLYVAVLIARLVGLHIGHSLLGR